MTLAVEYEYVPTDGDDEVPLETMVLPSYFGRWNDWIRNFLKGGTLSPEERLQFQDRPTAPNVDTLLIHAESVRLIAYALFWLQIAFAAIFTIFMISPSQIENSDLKKTFGYNNICVLLDYSPSREYVAMIYPLFEYTFFYYVILDYIHLRLSKKEDARLDWLLKMSTVALPIKLLFIGWFRMIFVYNIQQPKVPFGVRGIVGHTLAFFGLQIALIMVAFEHIAFIWVTRIEYPIGALKIRFLSAIYFCLFVLCSTFQMAFAFNIFMGNDFLNVTGDNPNHQHQLLIVFVDRIWLVLVGIMPILFALVGRKTQACVEITLKLNSGAQE